MSIEYDENDDELKFIAEHVVKRQNSSIRSSKVNLRIDPNKSEYSDSDVELDKMGFMNLSLGRKNRYVVINEDLDSGVTFISPQDDTGQAVDIEDSFAHQMSFDLSNDRNSINTSDISNDVLDDIDGIKERTGKRSNSTEDLLSVMKIEDDGRVHFLDNFKQILNHESRHLVLLNTIHKFKHILRESKVSEEVLNSIFYNIGDLIKAQNNLVVCLENMIAQWDLNKHLCADMMDLYVTLHMGCKDYVKNIAHAIIELRSLFEKNERIFDAMNIVMYEGAPLRMEVLIAKPTNWLCNSMENIKSVIETAEGHCDVDMIKETWKKLKDNSDVRLTNSTLEKNVFVRSGMFVEMLPNDQRRLVHLFLFSGMLVCVKQRLVGDGNAISKLTSPSTNDSLSSHSHNSLTELRPIERFEAKWFIPLQNIIIHQTKTMECCEKRKLEISIVKDKIRDLRLQFLSEKAKVSENFSFRKMMIKKDVDNIQNKLIKAETELILLSPTISFCVSNLFEKTHNLLVFSVKELEIWKRDIVELKKETNIVDTSHSLLLNVTNFIDSYRGSSAVIEVANGPFFDHTNDDGISGVVVTTIESVVGLQPVYRYYISIEVDSFNVNEIQARTRERTCDDSLSWNESFDIDLDCSHVMNILLYQVKKLADEKESLYGCFEFKLDLEEIDNKSVTKSSSVIGDDSSLLQIKVSFKIKTSTDLMKRQPSITTTELFGVAIESIIEREKTRDSPPVDNVPIILWACLKRIEDDGLDEEGIYRISGNKNEIVEFYKRLNKSVVNTIRDIGIFDLHTITGMVKLYLRELPEPLMLSENYINLLKISNIPEEEERYRCYSELIRQLPEPNHSTVVYILKHFQRVVAHSNKNHMVASNLGLIVGPTLILPPSNHDKQTTPNFALETMNSMYLSRVFTQLLNGICGGAVNLDLPPHP